MNDEREIENLIYRYAELIDAGDLSAVAGLFRDASIVAPDGSTRSGHEAVLEMYRASTRIYPDSGTPCTRHVTSNVALEVDAESGTARAASYFTVFQALPDFPLQPIICGRYVDRFVKQSGTWQFQRREMHPDLFGDLSRHLLFDAESLKLTRPFFSSVRFIPLQKR